MYGNDISQKTADEFTEKLRQLVPDHTVIVAAGDERSGSEKGVSDSGESDQYSGPHFPSLNSPAVSAAESDIVLLLEIRTTVSGKPIETAGSSDELVTGSDDCVVIERKPAAPVTFFYDPAICATESDIACQKYGIRPLDEISLPEKALSFESLYPGEEGYGIFSETVVMEMKGSEVKKSGKKEKLSLQIFEALRNHYVYPGTETLSGHEITWLAFTGDIMAGRGVDTLLASPDGIDRVFGDTLGLLRESSYTMGNLEGAVTGSGTRTLKSYNFRFPFHVLPRLREAGFDYLSVTNNHSFDYGIEGFLDTLSSLEKAGIATSGAGADISEAVSPLRVRVCGNQLNIFSIADYPPEKTFSGRRETEAGEVSPGIAWPSESFFSSLKAAAGPESTEIVLVHGGFEWSSIPAAGQIALYRKLAETGADMVIGSHPHVLQPAEIHHGSLIAYSLGNFIFPGMEETEFGEETIILRAGLSGGRIRYLDFHPVRISGKTVSIDSGGVIMERFYPMNRKWNSDIR